MADYSIDGIDYTIDDSLDLPSTVAKIRASDQHFRRAATAGNTFAGAYGENLGGAALAAGDFMTGIPGMIAGAGAGVSAFAQGEPVESAKNIGRATGEWFNPLTHIDALQPYRETGAYQGAMKPFEMIPEGIGQIGKHVGEAIGDEQLGQQFQQVGEFGTDLLAGAAMGRGLVGSGLKYRAKQEAKAKARTDQALKDIDALQQQMMSEQASKANEMQTQPDMFEPEVGPPTSKEVGAGNIRPGGEISPLQPDMFDTGTRTPEEMAVPQRGGGPIPFEPGLNMLDSVGPDATSPRIGPEGAGGPYARGSGYTPDPLLETPTRDPRVFSNQKQPYSAVSAKDPAMPKVTQTPNTEGLQFPRPGFLEEAVDKIQGKPSPNVEISTKEGPVLKDLTPVGPSKQLGGMTIENKKATARNDFIKEARARGITLPTEQLNAVWDKSQGAAPKPLAHPSEPAIDVIGKIKGIDQLQRQYVDRRTIDEIKPQIAAMKKDTLAQFAGRNTVDKMLAGGFIAKDNPLLSWVSSQTNWTKNESIQNANNRLHGLSRKMPNVGTFNYMWEQLPQRSRVAVTDLVVALRNSDVKLGEQGIRAKAREIIGRDLSPKELQAFLDRDRTMNDVLGDINKVYIAEGKEPIQQLPHYGFPSIFDGPFKVKWVNEKTGETVKVDAFYLKPNLAKLQKLAGPDVKAIQLPDSGLRGDVNWQQFEWILRQLNKEMRDPAAKAITEGLRRMGFGARTMRRAGVLGAKGTEGGITGMRGYEEISERYIRQAYDFIANRKLDKLYQDVNDMKEADHVPFTKSYALESIDVARGKSNEIMDKLGNAFSSIVSGNVKFVTKGTVVLPQRFTRDLLQQSNKVMTTLLLGFFHPIQIAAQFLQAPTYMPPKLLAMAAEEGRNPAIVMNALGKALVEYKKWNGSKDAQILDSIGAFEAQFRYDWSTYAGDANPRFKQTMSSHLSGLSTLSWLEAAAVRRPAAHMFLEMLRELDYDKIAKDKNEIYYVAKEMTDHYMVTNKFYKKPHAFNRTGLVGQAIGPLQNFSMTWLGMLREDVKLSGQGLKEGSISKQLPLGTFLASNLLTSGVLGIIGIKEWDALAFIANKLLGTNIMSGTEWMMSNFKSNRVRFGVLSDAIGANIGASLNAPTLTGSFAPGLQLLGHAANIGLQGLKSTGLFGEVNKPTNVEKRDALKGITPRFSPIPGLNWGDIEKHYTRPGAPYQESSGRAGPYTRDKADELARRLGTYTNKEAAAKGEFYAAQKDMAGRKAIFDKSMNRAVDIMLNDPQSYKNLAPIWQELGKRGFSGDNIKQGLMNEIQSQLIQGDYRAMGKLQSTKQQQLAILLQRLKGQR